MLSLLDKLLIVMCMTPVYIGYLVWMYKQTDKREEEK